MYSLSGYLQMIADRVRMDAYEAALRATVREGAVVLDIGTGPGVAALLACGLGARRVYAIEPAGVIEVARRAARDNGCADRIEFIQGLSTTVTLPERADVIVSDLRSVLPLFESHVAAIADARARLLAPGGVLIPRRDTLHAALVEAPEEYRRLCGWDDAFGADLKAARALAVNSWMKAYFEPAQLLTPPQCFALLDYTTITPGVAGGEPGWTVERAGTAHGLAVWFDTVLAEGIGFSNAPGASRVIYGNAFFPLEAPVAVSPGDRVSALIQGREGASGCVWRWDTTIRDGHADGVKARFRQSTIAGVPLSPEQVRGRSSAHVPAPGPERDAAVAALRLLDGQRSLEAVARVLAERFPRLFPGWEAALPFVAELAGRYGR